MREQVLLRSQLLPLYKYLFISGRSLLNTPLACQIVQWPEAGAILDSPQEKMAHM